MEWGTGGKADGDGTGQGTTKGGAGGSEKGNRDWKRTSVRWWGTRRSNGSPTSGGVPIRFGTYNIRNGRNGGLELALWRMAQANMDLGILHSADSNPPLRPFWML